MSERDRSGSSAEGDLLYEQNGQPQALEGEGDWYRFRVKGHLSPCWSEWLGGLAIALIFGSMSSALFVVFVVPLLYRWWSATT